MEKEKTKQIRSISVDSETYYKFRTICTIQGYIMSVQFEKMMEKFIADYAGIMDASCPPEKDKK